jgi:hypothetical protein
MSDPQRCSHVRAVPVESDGETVAALCPDCDRRLPAAWLSCPHERTVEIPMLGDLPPYRVICEGCSVVFWPDDAEPYAEWPGP